MTGGECKHKRCRFLAASAQVECDCGHAKEQHRRGGRHKCDVPLCVCIAFTPRRSWVV